MTAAHVFLYIMFLHWFVLYLYLFVVKFFLSCFVICTNLPSSILVCMPCHNTFFSSTLSLFWLHEFLNWTFYIYLCFFCFRNDHLCTWTACIWLVIYLPLIHFTVQISAIYMYNFFEWKVWYRIVYFRVFQLMHYVLSLAHLFASRKYYNLFNII